MTVAITTSLGYDGNLTEDQISTWAQFLGGPPYQLGDHAAWKVTDAAGDRTVQVAPGWGYGKGVADYNDAAVTSGLQSSAVASGSRWDLIVATRNWSTNTTTYDVIEGTSTKAIPAARTSRAVDSGATDDQPLALVRYTAGQTEPQEIIDLRVFNGIGRDLLAFVDPVVGDVAKVGTAGSYTEYVYDLDSVGNPAWLELKSPRIRVVRTGSTSYPSPVWTPVPFDQVVAAESNATGVFEYVASTRRVAIRRSGRFLVEATGRASASAAMKVVVSPSGAEMCWGKLDPVLGAETRTATVTLAAGTSLRLEQLFYAGGSDAAGASLTVTMLRD